MCQIELKIPNINFHSFTSISDWACMLTSLFSQYTLLHVSALKGPSSVSTDTFCQRPCRSPAEILGSNPTGGMDICLL